LQQYPCRHTPVTLAGKEQQQLNQSTKQHIFSLLATSPHPFPAAAVKQRQRRGKDRAG